MDVTVVSTNFLAFSHNGEFVFVPHPWHNVEANKAMTRLRDEHPCLTRRGILVAVDREEAEDILRSLEARLCT